MKKMCWPVIAGGLLSLLGLSVIVGWYIHLIILTAIVPGYISMVFNTAFCFAVAGLGLIGAVYYPLWANRIYTTIGITILLIASLVLSQSIFEINVGIDQLFVKPMFIDQNPFPGRMATNTAIAFILAGISLILIPCSRTRVIALVIQCLIFLVILLGLSALIGYVLKFQLLYSWYRFTQMAIHTATGMIILGTGLAAAWQYYENQRAIYKGREDKKIILSSGFILICATFAAGLISLSAFFKNTQNTLQRLMQQNLNNKVDYFLAAVNSPLNQAKDIISSTFLIDAISAKKLGQSQGLTTAADFLLKAGFSAIEITDLSAHSIVMQGKFANQPAFILSLNQNSKLLWQKGWILRINQAVLKQQKKIGMITLEWPLTTINQLFNDDNNTFGESSDTVICASFKPKQATCLPARLTQRVFEIALIQNGKPLPMYYALRGQQGITEETLDYRHKNIIAAYSPIGNLGLGIVNKIDVNELYQPIKKQLQRVIPLILLIIIIGILFIYYEILPFVRKIIQSEQKALLEQKRAYESEARFRSSFNDAAIGMGIVSIEGQWLKVNESFCQLIGYSAEELLTKTFQNITHPDDIEISLHKVNQLLKGETKSYQLEKRYLHKNGNIIWVAISVSLVFSPDKKPLYYIAQIQDITAKKDMETQLKQMAYYDALTHLANRTQLEYGANQLLASARRYKKIIAFFFLDLDKFKNINDTLGHDAGDVLLKTVSERLKACARASDIVARLGGDEFVIVYDDVKGIETAAFLAEKMIHTLVRPMLIKGHELFVTTSVGISLYPNDGTDYQTLVKNADLALYHAKEKGRNNYQFCTSEVSIQVQEKLAFEKALQQAVVKEEFQLHYQPKVDVANKKIIGMEALLRWSSREYGLVVPQQIIPLAEETGIIIPVSEWVVRTACKQAKIWQEMGFKHLQVAINIAAQQFKKANFIDSLLAILQETKLPPHCLELEINENLAMQDPEYSATIFNSLKREGLNIAIDNFGTGYSSINCLQHFGIDRIKIDRTFISSIGTDKAVPAIITATIALAKNLGIKVIAEGVENKQQYDFLIQYECNEMQGYYFCKPSPVDEATRKLREMDFDIKLIKAE
jgi:diguanylate cyclase (GGDEF)-like protein/PAS domain S-box-containing protein